ncbi:hypothetical protein M231_01918 [Tremella mesenterica]|uniref:Uncharacterized protein n=1 Tax=Tremella mesenterica TaxID=5217 RepID=A0A4Q1BS74_TREME|nr:hypothetical protein M231_01918 [Tremella mesenterica]
MRFFKKLLVKNRASHLLGLEYDGELKAILQSVQAPEYQRSKPLPGQRELCQISLLTTEPLTHGTMENATSRFTAENGAKEMAVLTLSGPDLKSTLWYATFKVENVDGTYAVKAYGFHLVSRDPKQKQVVGTDTSPNGTSTKAIPINCTLPDAEVISWAMQNEGVVDLYKSFTMASSNIDSNGASGSSSHQISVTLDTDFEMIKGQFLAALSEDLPPELSTNPADIVPATASGLSDVGHGKKSKFGQFHAHTSRITKAVRKYIGQSKTDSHESQGVNVAPQAMAWCQRTRPRLPSLSDNNSSNVLFLSQSPDRDESLELT